MRDIFKKSAKLIAFTLCAAILFCLISQICMPKSYDGPWNQMAKLNEFYSLEKNSLDYICVGSSHVYCSVNPLEVWKSSGVAGFVLATQQQPLEASYYYIKEAFKTQSPKYVILEGYMISDETVYDSSVLHYALDPLKPSLNKFHMINALVDFEQRPEYYFNIAKYHTRWNTVTADEINGLFEEHTDTYKGFVALENDYSGKNFIPDYDSVKDTELSARNKKILDDIYKLTVDNGAQLVLMLAPHSTDYPELLGLLKAEKKWAEAKNIPVLDYSEMTEKLNIDPERDYYDARHLDVSGAAKISSHFADFLVKNGLSENTRIDTEKWQADYDIYYKSFSAVLTES